MSPQKICSSPKPQYLCDFIWKQVLWRCNQDEIRVNSVGPNAVMGILTRRGGKFGHRDRNTQKKDSHVKAEAETGVIQVQAKERKGQQATTGAKKERFFPSTSGGSMTNQSCYRW